MKYMGSKNRIAKQIIPFIVTDMNKPFYDVFCGGCNIIDKIVGKRFANDNNFYLIEMFKLLREDISICREYSRQEYEHIRDNKELYPPGVVGYVGFNCSYCGKWFGGYAGTVNTKQGVRNYQIEAIKNIRKQIPLLDGVVFSNTSFENINITGSIIYCDPPYKETTGYNNIVFNYDLFYNWCRYMSDQDNKVYVSEYNMPSDFRCIIEIPVKSSLSANGLIGNSKISIEKLFTL